MKEFLEFHLKSRADLVSKKLVLTDKILSINETPNNKTYITTTIGFNLAEVETPIESYDELKKQLMGEKND